jgi:DNA invertase Pin-like site-specific DNA recombinase
MKNETLYIYVRDSMDNMESLDTQKKKGIELSKKLGMDYEIIDDGLEDWIINRKVKNLFVFDISRLSRKGETFNQYLNLMSNNGVELFTIDGKVDKRIEQLYMGIIMEIITEKISEVQ